MGFYSANHVRQRQCARQLKQHVDVIRHAAREERLTADIVRRGAKDPKQRVTPSGADSGSAVLGGEDDVDVHFGRLLGHCHFSFGR